MKEQIEAFFSKYWFRLFIIGVILGAYVAHAQKLQH